MDRASVSRLPLRLHPVAFAAILTGVLGGCGLGTVAVVASSGSDGSSTQNQLPTATLNNDLFVENPDQRRGIPITFSVSDKELDDIEVVLQWRYADQESFPDLGAAGSSAAAVLAMLEEPGKATEMQVCTELRRFLGGRVAGLPSGSPNGGGSFDETLQVRLPELASTAAALLAGGLGGRELEILRNSAVPEEVDWASNPLNAPLAALPGSSPLTALVLDAAPGGWEVREIQLTTGEELGGIASSTVDFFPTAMAVSQLGSVLFVASASTSGPTDLWRVDRILPDGTQESISGDFTFTYNEGLGVRGITALTDTTALITVDSQVEHLDFNQGTSTPLIEGLSVPWGIVHDPRVPNRVFVAEHLGHQVLEIDLFSHSQRPIFAQSPSDGGGPGPDPFPFPTALALEGEKNLLVVTEAATPGDSTLKQLRLNSPEDADDDGAADALVTELVTVKRIGGVATGDRGLRILSIPNLGIADQGLLAVGGGVAQLRTLVEGAGAYDTATQVATVTEPFEPVPAFNQPWSIAFPTSLAQVSSSGANATFLWDTSDVPAGGLVNVRVVPLDKKLGNVAEGETSKSIQLPLTEDPGPQTLVTAIGVGATPDLSLGEGGVAIADLDQDGDLDLAMAMSGYNNTSASSIQEFGVVSLAFQTEPGVFGDSDPFDQDDTIEIPAAGGQVERPRSVAAGDLNGDGFTDLVTSNETESDVRDLAILFQSDLNPGVFAFGLDVPIASGRPNFVIPVDLDDDGDLDLATAAAGADLGWVHTHVQTAPGTFAPLEELPLPGFEISPGTSISRPRAVLSADLDFDGDVDLIAADERGRNLTVLYREGGLHDSELILISDQGNPEDGPRNGAVVDLDADGDLDVIAANASSAISSVDAVGNLLLFEQTSPGTFDCLLEDESGLCMPLGDELAAHPRSVAAGDYNRDGLFDVVAADYFGDRLVPFMQGPIDEFGSNLSLGTNGTDGPKPVLTADLDGDGQLDLVCSNLEDFTMNVFLARPRGAFALESTSTLGNAVTLFGTKSLAHGDLDGDGDLDLIAGNGLNASLTQILQDGAGFFFPQESFAKGASEVVDLELADLNGDGRLDIISPSDEIVGGEGEFTAVFLQNDDGGFNDVADQRLVVGVALYHNPTSVAVGDLDLDGDVDVVVGNRGTKGLAEGRSLTVFHGSPSGLSTTPDVTLDGAGTPLQPVDVVVCDLNADGFPDLAEASLNNEDEPAVAHAGIFLSASGTLPSAPSNLFPISNGPSALDAEDLDRDGDLDLAVSVAGGAELVELFFQTTPGVFDASADPLVGAPELATLGTEARSLTISDLDGDGDRDIAVAVGEPADVVQIFFQDRPGVFARDPLGPTKLNPGGEGEFHPRKVISADLDGDGDIDLATCNPFSNNVTILWGGH